MLLFATSPTLIEASTFACKCENIPPSLKNELMYFLNQQEKTEELKRRKEIRLQEIEKAQKEFELKQEISSRHENSLKLRKKSPKNSKKEKKVPTIEDLELEDELLFDEEVLNSIPRNVVIELSNFLTQLKENTFQKSCLHDLLDGSRIVFQKPKPTRRNPELVARLKRLQAEAQEREYQGLIKNITPNEKDTFKSDLSQIKEDTRHITAIINGLFSIIGVFFALYFLSTHLFHQMAFRILFALLGALVVAFAEAWLFVRYTDLLNK